METNVMWKERPKRLGIDANGIPSIIGKIPSDTHRRL
jgi:hypothetical protein